MKVICFGDSLTSCGGEDGRYSDILQDRFPHLQIINKGKGGDNFVEARARLAADVLEQNADLVLLELGANDWWRNERPPEAWAADLEDLIRQVQATGAKVAVLGVFWPYRDPTTGLMVEKTYGIDERARAFREMERAIALRLGCAYVPNIQEDIIANRCGWRDRNHPNELGNRWVADRIEPVLTALTGDAPLPIRKPTLRTTRDFWDEAVALAPDHLAAVDGERRLTYAQANEIVERLAAGLAAAAGTERPKVAVHLPNCLEYYLIYWAVVRLGGAIVPLNLWLKEDNLQHIFRNVRPEVLIVRRAQDRTPLLGAQAAPPRATFALEAGGGLRPYAELLAGSGAAPRPTLGPDDVSIIMHTSGTTAAPKGGMMRHSDLMFNVMAAINAHQFAPSDVHLLVNPMFHCTALYSSLPTAAYQKASVIITAETDAAHLMDLVARERISTFLTIPAICQRLVGLPDLARRDHSSLRVIAYAGSMMPVSTIRKLQAAFPEVKLHNFFGLTETISMTHVLKGEDAEARPDSIGRLLPFVRAIVVDEHNVEAPRGTVGELLFARANVIPGYYNEPGRLEEAVTTINGEPWFRTGDLALVDEEGYCFIKGRKKDMIIVGGENVFAAEVEPVLMAHDKVREAAIKGIPATGAREALGELIKAYVVKGDASLTEPELRRYCHQKLASFKIPHYVVFLDALPRNPSGKVVKAELPD